jgi:hypothetical protein
MMITVMTSTLAEEVEISRSAVLFNRILTESAEHSWIMLNTLNPNNAISHNYVNPNVILEALITLWR